MIIVIVPELELLALFCDDERWPALKQVAHGFDFEEGFEGYLKFAAAELLASPAATEKFSSAFRKSLALDPAAPR